jgi:hypothetical protein
MVILHHDLTHSPVALWQLNGNLLDSSGNGYHMSALNGCTPKFFDIIPGLIGWSNQGASTPTEVIGISNPASALRITGDLTIEALCAIGLATGGGLDTLFRLGAATDAAADNVLYALFVQADTTTLTLQYIHESGSGVDRLFTTVNNLGATGPIMHLALTRISNVVRIYINGELIHTSAALVAPTGGTSTSAYLTFGAFFDGTNRHGSRWASIKIISSGLSDADVLAEYNRTLGQHYPVIIP